MPSEYAVFNECTTSETPGAFPQKPVSRDLYLTRQYNYGTVLLWRITLPAQSPKSHVSDRPVCAGESCATHVPELPESEPNMT